MKRKFRVLIGVGLITLAVSGCSTIRAGEYSSPLNVGGVMAKGLEADIEVGEKITGIASETKILHLLTFGPREFADGVIYGVVDNHSIMGGLASHEELKAAAAYDAISNSGADFIIAPRYKIQDDDFFIVNSVKVTVIGYKGIIKGIKTAKTQ